MPDDSHETFDPELPQRLEHLLATIAASPECYGLDDDHIWVIEHGDKHISLAELTQLRHRLAYAERTRAELADKCATLRQERDELHARLDQAADLVLSLFAHVSSDTGTCRVPPHSGEECPRPAALAFLRTLTTNQKPKDPS